MGLIRFLLAVSVVIFHSSQPIYGLTLVNGFTAVKLFFIVSGFYMAMILNGKYTSYSSFIFNRVLKLFPTYWVVLTLCFIYSEPKFTDLNDYWSLYFLISNIFILGSHLTSVIIDRFGEITILPFGDSIKAQEMTWKYLYIGPIWSLSVEFLFYLTAPLLLRRPHFGLKMCAIFLISASTCAFLISKNSWTIPWSYNLFTPSFYLFGLGAISWRLYSTSISKIFINKNYGFIAFLLLFIYIVAYQFLPSQVNLELVSIILDPVSIGIILFTLSIPFVFELTKRNRVDSFFGDLSYPIYISHFFIIYYFPYLKHWHPLVGTIILSLFFNLFLIKNINKFRARLVR